jgi:hypothetical protein
MVFPIKPVMIKKNPNEIDEIEEIELIVCSSTDIVEREPFIRII